MLIVSEIWTSLHLPPDAFKAKFGMEKRALKAKKLVLHCLKGKRAVEAADLFNILGYDNVFIYKVSLLLNRTYFFPSCFCSVAPNKVLAPETQKEMSEASGVFSK